jgi:broad specificity phosphatase PhoE
VLIIVRHGRTAANASGLLLGRADPELDELGHAQAAALAAAVPRVDRVVASPLRRAQQTAAAFGAPVETDERWIELDYGEWDGQPIGQVPAVAWAAWRQDLDFCPPGGECLADLGRRVRAACDDLVDAATVGDVVVVTHVSPVKAAVAWALGVGDEVTWRMYVAPASITRVDFRETRAVLVSFDEVAHLPVP